ncbi:hypothetical protein DFP72DRAFT_860265 [Ephemerocybe angulata]|uniref:Uncharacterized protein n=1 Tax=Ephemerocybe angulata TaxID=980116 RepID=A0A8H6HA10_9AGAR|nr:hypothetical protein DFP72DRAFT_860265 [Tulosesus angulatus]
MAKPIEMLVSLFKSLISDFKTSLLSEITGLINPSKEIPAVAAATAAAAPAGSSTVPPVLPPIPAAAAPVTFVAEEGKPAGPGFVRLYTQNISAAIINHTFNSYHLWELNPRLKNKSHKCILQLVGAFLEIASNEVSMKKFKDIPSLLIPLSYFEILAGAKLAMLFMRYMVILHEYSADYTLLALICYHIDFIYTRRTEMKRGYYNVWAHINGEVACKHLYANCHPTSTSK